MENTTNLNAIWKEDKAKLHTAISSLKKSMTTFKADRKAEWKSFKTIFNENMDNVDNSLKKLKALHKK